MAVELSLRCLRSRRSSCSILPLQTSTRLADSISLSGITVRKRGLGTMRESIFPPLPRIHSQEIEG